MLAYILSMRSSGNRSSRNSAKAVVGATPSTRWAQRCTCPPEQPICTCGGMPKAKLITRKPIEADAGELEENRRSRSAKLRVLEKL